MSNALWEPQKPALGAMLRPCRHAASTFALVLATALRSFPRQGSPVDRVAVASNALSLGARLLMVVRNCLPPALQGSWSINARRILLPARNRKSYEDIPEEAQMEVAFT